MRYTMNSDMEDWVMYSGFNLSNLELVKAAKEWCNKSDSKGRYGFELTAMHEMNWYFEYQTDLDAFTLKFG